jgi:hypothetical protein
MNSGEIVLICFAVPVAICLAVREYRWRERLRNWERSEGRIVGFDEDPNSDMACPVVGYRFRGQEKEQVCEFNLRHHGLGQTVPILMNRESGEIFVLTSRDRWTLSAVLLGCLAFMGLLAVVSN